MTSFKKISVLTGVSILLVMGLTFCDNSTEADTKDTSSIGSETSDASLTIETLQKTFPPLTYLGELNEAEIEGLLFMREEEKLARDVYLTMNDLYGLRVFNNISRSEQIHMNAVKFLLDRYELDDPAEGKAIGEFINPGLQALYDELIIKGSIDEIEALKVGAFIEETDIADLQEHIAELDENPDIEFVYTNLLRGSGFHLKAFIFNLKVRGVDYNAEPAAAE